MSAASSVVLRSGPPPGPRHSLFWPMLILLLGLGAFALYQVISMENQLDEITRAINKMDGKVKMAQYEQAKFYSMAADLLRLAPKDPTAEQLVTYFKLRDLQAAQPGLMSQPTPQSAPTSNAAPTTTPETTNTGTPGTTDK